MFRGILLLALAVMLLQSLREGLDSGGQAVSVRGASLKRSLPGWSVSPRGPESIHVQLDNVPARIERVWLGALAAAGSRLSWSGEVHAIMIDARPVASPVAGTIVSVAAPNGVPIVMGDEVGVIDTVRAYGHGASLVLGSITDQITGSVGNSVASTVLSDSVLLRKILVIGSAGWESKFVVAALEEDGWEVDTFIRVAPRVDVTHGSAAVIDTSRYSAVVVLNGAEAAYANRIIEFARMGGGVVLGPHAASVNGMALLRSGAVSRAIADTRESQPGGSTGLATLALAPITSLRSDAVALEKRAGAVTRAAKRIDAGRALQLGYEDTWQWRMGGGEGAVRDHRVWWTGLLSSVSYAPHVWHAMTATSPDRAPMPGLVAAIGPSTPQGNMPAKFRDGSHWAAWLFALLVLALFGEIASRRLRGGP